MNGEILDGVAKAQEFAERSPEEMKKRAETVFSEISEKYGELKDGIVQRLDRYL